MTRFYRLVQLIIDLLVLRGRADRSKDVEILWVPNIRPGTLTWSFVLW